MLFQHIYDEDLAQASYLIGCQATGEAIVVDPRRDVERFVALAARHGLRIAHVTETHIHADFQSGSRELAARTGARLHLSAEGAPDWSYDFEGDTTSPRRRAARRQPSRPSGPHARSHPRAPVVLGDRRRDHRGARLLPDRRLRLRRRRRPARPARRGRWRGRHPLRGRQAPLRQPSRPLPHAARTSSRCGLATAPAARAARRSARSPSTTVGYERLVAWWVPFVQAGDEQGFVDVLLDGQPDAPLYFGRMKVTNKAGPQLLGERRRCPSSPSMPCAIA